MPRELCHGFRARIERVDIELAVAIGPEVHDVAQPHRVGVVGASLRLWNLVHLVVFHVVEAHFGGLAAAVVFPLEERERERVVGDAVAAG